MSAVAKKVTVGHGGGAGGSGRDGIERTDGPGTRSALSLRRRRTRRGLDGRGLTRRRSTVAARQFAFQTFDGGRRQGAAPRAQLHRRAVDAQQLLLAVAADHHHALSHLRAEENFMERLYGTS